ncbi:hypothetical protein AA313_de0205542 [Arthrobotrys entomopaga]|nr:hypothetical protein AA313_de0205542 [Arthrobotrys entomopaga]
MKSFTAIVLSVIAAAAGVSADYGVYAVTTTCTDTPVYTPPPVYSAPVYTPPPVYSAPANNSAPVYESASAAAVQTYVVPNNGTYSSVVSAAGYGASTFSTVPAPVYTATGGASVQGSGTQQTGLPPPVYNSGASKITIGGGAVLGLVCMMLAL